MGVSVAVGEGVAEGTVVAAAVATMVLVGGDLGRAVIAGGEVAVGFEVAGDAGVNVASGMTEIPEPPQAAAKKPIQVAAEQRSRPRLASIRRSCRRRWSGPGP